MGITSFCSKLIFGLLVVLLILLFSCNQQNTEKQDTIPPSNIKESLIEANKKAVKTEEQQINDFIRRVKWKMLETGTGLKYSIYKKGDGEPAVTGKVVEIEYTVSLLNGDLVYSSETLGNKVFTIGKGGVESGLEEGILLLREGDCAKIILPSHLAFGLMGDQRQIPPKTTLVYDIKVITIR